MIVYILLILIIAILSFVVGISIANLLFWFASYAISSFFASFVKKNQKMMQGFIQTILLFAITVYLLVYSHQHLAPVKIFAEGSGSIERWFLISTGLVSGVITLVALALAFDKPEKQKSLEAEKAAQSQGEKIADFK